MARFPAVTTSTEGHRVTTFELFFDLVFVFAFTQVTEFMVHEHDAVSVLQAMTLLTLLWWSWVSYSWLSNQTHVDEGIVRIGMSVSMAAVFVVALVIPEAYHDMEGGLSGPVVLVVCYAVVRAIHLALYVLAAGDDIDLRRQILITLIPFGVEIALLVAGALIGGPLQTVLWATAVVANGALTYATSRGGHWRVHSAAHWTERYGLVVILAIGESIVAIGVGASAEPISTPILVGSALAVALAVLVWWLYFDVVSIAAEHQLARRNGAVRAALAVEAYTFMHLPVIAGVVLTALGVETAIGHLDDPEPFGLYGSAALLGGTSLFVASHAAFARRMIGVWKTWRLGAATALLALIPIAAAEPPLAALTIVVLLTAAPVAIESVFHGAFRRDVRSGAYAARER